MKQLILITLILLVHKTRAQETWAAMPLKKTNKICITTSLDEAKAFMQLKKALIAYGYTINKQDTSLLTVTTDPKTIINTTYSTTINAYVLTTDSSRIYISAVGQQHMQITGYGGGIAASMNDYKYVIENTGGAMKKSWQELNNFANTLPGNKMYNKPQN